MWRSILATTCGTASDWPRLYLYMRSRDVAQYISHNICHVCGTVWRSVRRVARVMVLASEASTPCQLQPGTLAILKEANSCTIRQSLGGRYPGAPSSGVWCRVLSVGSNLIRVRSVRHSGASRSTSRIARNRSE